MVGAGPQLDQLTGAYPDVCFVGIQKGLDLARFYAAADVLIFPSKTDTFGLVMLEALACGVPVAAYPVTGPLDVVGQADVGVLDEDLGKAAREALHKSPEACRRHAQRFTWAASAAQFKHGLAPLH